VVLEGLSNGGGCKAGKIKINAEVKEETQRSRRIERQDPVIGDVAATGDVENSSFEERKANTRPIAE